MRHNPEDMKYPAFAKWLWAKFLMWQSQAEKRKKLGEFADWLGVSRATLSQWWLGKARPNAEMAFTLGKRLGIEVYQQAGLAAPDKTLFDIMCHWENMSEARKKELARVLYKPSYKE